MQTLAACSTPGVAIEINVNPWRLDLDWRCDRGLELGNFSINPDAHSTSEIDLTKMGQWRVLFPLKRCMQVFVVPAFCFILCRLSVKRGRAMTDIKAFLPNQRGYKLSLCQDRFPDSGLIPTDFLPKNFHHL